MDLVGQGFPKESIRSGVGQGPVRSPKIPQIISGNFFSHAMDHRTEQVPQRGVLIKTPPKGAGFESGALGLLFSGRDEKGQLSRA
ncbi:hypothetical protein AVEN_2836-1 [Araneus ventricosus]|uniref:Uncharacterized protein n=1 Tax=Araneus ventricosus TaxID=182803 RepID=A0A4Y2EJJ9_ARAVE|nr:hypothetical protein AVEN_2836-1 [Araneus ventricosus]